jgi:hypothetical protein
MAGFCEHGTDTSGPIKPWELKEHNAIVTPLAP